MMDETNGICWCLFQEVFIENESWYSVCWDIPEWGARPCALQGFE